MKIQVDAEPTVPYAGGDREICSDNFNLEGNSVTIGLGNWTLVSGSGSLQNASLNNTTINSLGIGANVFKWTIQNGVCPAKEDEVTITRDEPPSLAVVENDIEVDKPVIQLSATAPTVGTGYWTVIEGPAVIDDANQ